MAKGSAHRFKKCVTETKLFSTVKLTYHKYLLVELVGKHIYLFVPAGKVDELFVIKAKLIDEAGHNMPKQVNNLPWNAEVRK